MSKANPELKNIIVPVLLGPTAVGKTAYALEIAENNSWEILSCDSRQIYRLMDIGTAKPDKLQLKKVKHWLVDIKNPDELYSAYDFSRDALRIIRERNVCGKTVLICGGTGLYFKALSEGLHPGVETDPVLKEQLMARGLLEGTVSLHEELQRIDPESSKSIHTHDLQRVVRALAVYYQTGIPFSRVRQTGTPPQDITFRTIKLTKDRHMLYRSIDARVLKMINDGLVEEFKTLLKNGLHRNTPGMQCVGYRELFPHFDQKIDINTAIDDIQRNSRRYAKRQCTWFVHQTLGIEMESGTPSGKLEDFYKNI